MRIESGKTFDIDEVLNKLSRNLLENYNTFINDSDNLKDCFYQKFLPMLAYLNQEVIYQSDNEEPRTVKVIGLNEDGYLILDTHTRKHYSKTGRIRPVI